MQKLNCSSVNALQYIYVFLQDILDSSIGSLTAGVQRSLIRRIGSHLPLSSTQRARLGLMVCFLVQLSIVGLLYAVLDISNHLYLCYRTVFELQLQDKNHADKYFFWFWQVIIRILHNYVGT